MSYNKSHDEKHKVLDNRLKRLERLILVAIVTNLPNLISIFFS